MRVDRNMILQSYYSIKLHLMDLDTIYGPGMSGPRLTMRFGICLIWTKQTGGEGHNSW